MRFLLGLVLLCLPGAALAQAPVELPLSFLLDPRIETILAPLSGMPTIQRADELLAVELAPGAAVELPAIGAALTPSFGAIRTRVELGTPVAVTAGTGSRLWPGRTVDRLDYRIPAGLLPDLYDLEVAAPSGLAATDLQRRAVSIVGQYPATPRVVVIADPSVGDPRPVQDAALDAIQRGEIAQAALLVQRSLGNPVNSERWAAFSRVIQEINLVRPDFVLVTGDLTFLVYPQALPYEYEDVWNLLDRLEVPAFVTPGNHDLYAVDDYLGDTPPVWDGKQLWQRYFGPLYYSADVGPRLHLASLNTFEWPQLDPFPVEDEFDTRAAGQVLGEQLAWLDADLHAYRDRAPDGMLLTFAHHDPSWMQRRHAWLGEGRLETRDLFAATGVGAHFSGHTHEDRVARFYNGDVVETNGRPHVEGHVVRQLHLLKRDGELDTSLSQQALGAILRDPAHGPLFVSTTTAASQLVGDIWGLGGYWGWRLAHLIARDGSGGLDPFDLGYPVTDAYLEARAERPENWTAEHAQYGVFSYPSYELDREITEGGDGAASRTTLRITSRLLADLEVRPRLLVAASRGQPLVAEGAELLQVRYGEGIAEGWLKATAKAGSEVEVSLSAVNANATQAESFGGALTTGLSLLLMAVLFRRRAAFNDWWVVMDSNHRPTG